MKYIILTAVFLYLGQSASASTKEFCGKRDGTAGNAALVDSKGSEVVTLATQGEGDSLLEQTDKLIGRNSGVKGEHGTQNGKNYCVLAELNDEGEPVKILKAWLKK